MLEPNSACFTAMSFVIPKTPPLETFIYCQVLTQKKKIKEIASFRSHNACENALFHFVISHHLSIYLRYYDLILANFLSFRFVSVHKRAKGVRRIFSRLDRPSMVSKINKNFSCWTKRTTFEDLYSQLENMPVLASSWPLAGPTSSSYQKMT